MIKKYKNKSCVFTICHRRAQILSWKPQGQKDILWCTNDSFISLDRPIRGGIPLCWPWFGNGHKGDMTPSHGFARLAEWKLLVDQRVTSNTHHLVYQLSSDRACYWRYPNDFVVTLEYFIGDKLTILLEVDGLDDKPSFGALHSYFSVGDIEQTLIEGLGEESVDNLDMFSKVEEDRFVSVNGPTEKRFPRPKRKHKVKIHDKSNQRIIMVTQFGHSDTMLWSPWTESGHSIKDVSPGDYRRFVCVETAAISRPIKQRMSAQIELESP